MLMQPPQTTGLYRMALHEDVHDHTISFFHNSCTVEPRYNKVLVTMKITLLYQVSHYIRVKNQRKTKSWDQPNYLVIRGFCYIRPLYNQVPLYTGSKALEDQYKHLSVVSLKGPDLTYNLTPCTKCPSRSMELTRIPTIDQKPEADNSQLLLKFLTN